MIEKTFDHMMSIRQIKNENPKAKIIYIHGLGETGKCFHEVMTDSRLSHLSHFAPDLPGNGKTPTDKAMNFNEYIQCLATWLQSSQMGPVVIVGHSMGGVLGLLLCESYPELVQGFINVEGNISPEDCTLSAVVTQHSQEYVKGCGLQVILQDVCNQVSGKAISDYHSRLASCNPDVYYSNSEELVETSKSLIKKLMAIQVPHIYLFGMSNGISERSRQVLAKVGVKNYGIENAGHWLFIDQKDMFIDKMLLFLDEIFFHTNLYDTSFKIK